VRRARGFDSLVLKTKDGRFGGLGLKTIGVGFASLVLKTRCGRFGGLGLKTIDDGFDLFRPKTEEWRIGEHVVVSQSLH